MSMWWYDPFEFSRPSRILSQRFGLSLPSDDLIQPVGQREFNRLLSYPGYVRPWTSETLEKDAGSSVNVDKDKFQLALDVQQFRPDEITVKVTDDNTIVVEGKHEERPDEHGFISRQFTRKYIFPKDHDISRVQSSLSSDGVLTITAPKIAQVKCEQREIPIQQTGQPFKIAEKKPECKAEDANIHVQQEQKKEEKNIEIKQESKPSEAPGCQKSADAPACQKPAGDPACQKPAEAPACENAGEAPACQKPADAPACEKPVEVPQEQKK